MNMTPVLYINNHVQEILQRVNCDLVDKNLYDRFKAAAEAYSYGDFKTPDLNQMRCASHHMQNEDLFHVVNAYLDACEHIVRDNIDITGQLSRQVITAELEQHDRALIDKARLQLDDVFELCQGFYQDADKPVEVLQTSLKNFEATAKKFNTSGIGTVLSYAQHMLKLAEMLG